LGMVVSTTMLDSIPAVNFKPAERVKGFETTAVRN